jgi:hypothetical protein
VVVSQRSQVDLPTGWWGRLRGPVLAGAPMAALGLAAVLGLGLDIERASGPAAPEAPQVAPAQPATGRSPAPPTSTQQSSGRAGVTEADRSRPGTAATEVRRRPHEPIAVLQPEPDDSGGGDMSPSPDAAPPGAVAEVEECVEQLELTPEQVGC